MNHWVNISIRFTMRWKTDRKYRNTRCDVASLERLNKMTEFKVIVELLTSYPTLTPFSTQYPSYQGADHFPKVEVLKKNWHKRKWQTRIRRNKRTTAKETSSVLISTKKGRSGAFKGCATLFLLSHSRRSVIPQRKRKAFSHTCII